jgi:hypothetical protein
MPAADIAHVLGGRRCGNGYVVRCPAHQDRHPSLSLCDGERGLLVKCHAGCDARDVLAELRRRGLLDLLQESARRAEGTKDDHERRQRDKAKRLWSQRQPIVGTVAERYLCARGYDAPTPPTIAFLPARDAYPPAMIVAFGMPEEPEPGILAAPRSVNAVHLTRLKPDGSDRERGPDAKIMIGRSVGIPIVAAPVNDLLGLAITEGIEDALSVQLATGLGAWAAASAGRMPALADMVPSYVETVTIFAHPDKVGQDKARELASKLHKRGLEVFIEGIAP